MGADNSDGVKFGDEAVVNILAGAMGTDGVNFGDIFSPNVILRAYIFDWISLSDIVNYISDSVPLVKVMETIDEQNNLGLIVIDGIADLILEGNNQAESNIITQRIMTLSEKLNTHIILVIHNTYGVKKATGHLGSYLEKKAETICYLDREKNLTKVSFETRGFGIDDFAFTLDKRNLPVIEYLEF